MTVELNVFEGVDERGRQAFAVDVESDASVRDLARQAGVPLERIGMVTVDGRVRHLDYGVSPGQRVCLFPHIMGG